MAKSAKQAKQAKQAKPAAPAVATPAPAAVPAVTTVASTATKLTKRSGVMVGQVLVVTGKPAKLRAAHVQQAWQAIVAAAPATATQLATLPALAAPGCVSPQAFISYMLRRKYLAVKV